MNYHEIPVAKEVALPTLHTASGVVESTFQGVQDWKELMNGVDAKSKSVGTRQQWGNRACAMAEWAVENGAAFTSVDCVKLYLLVKGLNGKKIRMENGKVVESQGRTMITTTQIWDGIIGLLVMVHTQTDEQLEGAFSFKGGRVWTRLKPKLSDLRALAACFFGSNGGGKVADAFVQVKATRKATMG